MKRTTPSQGHGTLRKRELLWLISRTKTILLFLFVIVFSNTIISAAGVLFVAISKNIIDAATGGNPTELVSNGVNIVALSLSRLALESADKVLITRADLKLNSHIKSHLFRQIHAKNVVDIQKFEVGDLLTRMSEDVDIISKGILEIVPGITSLTVKLAASLAVLFMLDPFFAVVSLLIGPVTFFIGKVTGKWVTRLHIQIQENLSATRVFLGESLHNLPARQLDTEKYESLLTLNIKLQKRKNLLVAISGFGLSLGYWVGYVFAIIWGAFRLSTDSITFGTMAAFMQLVSQVQSPFVGISGIFPNIYSIFASTTRIVQICDLPTGS